MKSSYLQVKSNAATQGSTVQLDIHKDKYFTYKFSTLVQDYFTLQDYFHMASAKLSGLIVLRANGMVPLAEEYIHI